ncbi:hypothetical protein GCM10028819_03880 [Spirosoma humi]
MVHILTWKYQPEKRSTNWVRTIVNARQEIRELQEYMPSPNRDYVESVWQRTMSTAIEGAKAEMNLSKNDTFEPAELTWDEVFDAEYLL